MPFVSLLCCLHCLQQRVIRARSLSSGTHYILSASRSLARCSIDDNLSSLPHPRLSRRTCLYPCLCVPLLPGGPPVFSGVARSKAIKRDAVLLPTPSFTSGCRSCRCCWRRSWRQQFASCWVVRESCRPVEISQPSGLIRDSQHSPRRRHRQVHVLDSRPPVLQLADERGAEPVPSVRAIDGRGWI